MTRKKRNIVFENIEVTDVGAKGKAIAKAPDGKVIFLTNTVPGDIATIQITKKKRSYYEGRVVELIKLSDKRTQPVCGHFQDCGGCKWQHLQYNYQLFYKEKEVVDNLKRIGHLSLPEISPILGSEKQYFYRNKMEFSFSDNRWMTADEIASGKAIDSKHALGFHIAGMWDKILDIETCHLQEDPSNAIRNGIKAFAVENELEFFNTREQQGFLRTLMIRTSTTGEIMVVLQFFRDESEKRELLMEYIRKEFPQVTSLQYVINSKANDTLYDQQVIVYSGKDHIVEKMEDLQFRINAKSFYQTNSVQAYELYKIVREYAGLTGSETVYDLYTGTGTIAQFIAAKAKKVIGIESVPEAIVDARENAGINNIKNTEFYVGDMAKVFSDEFIITHGQPDVIITDPPRDGMHKNVIAQLLRIAPPKIVYVSCNSATQARDLHLLDESYKIVKTQAVDMFPQTHHVENVVLLELKK